VNCPCCLRVAARAETARGLRTIPGIVPGRPAPL